jgi:hypothetical protein
MPRNVDPGRSRMEYAQYVKHLRKDLGIDVSYFRKNVGAMADGYLEGVADAHSRLRTILNLKHGVSGFG